MYDNMSGLPKNMSGLPKNIIAPQQTYQLLRGDDGY